MKFIHTSDGPPLTDAEITHLEQAAHKLALGMQPGTTRRGFETVGNVTAYLVAGTPGAVHIHAVNDAPKKDLTYVLGILPNGFGPKQLPPDFVSALVHSDGRIKQFVDEETGCSIPQLFPEPSLHTEYVSPKYAAQKLAAVGGALYGATTFPPVDTEFVTFSQTSRKRPGYFTGMMASLVQLLLGAGRFISPSVYKQASEQKKVKNLIASTPLATDARTGLVDEPPNPSHFQYMKPFKKEECLGTNQTSDPFAMEVPWDYRWSRTHGVVLGTDRTIEGKTFPLGFIIDISDLGVYAYPIQVDPLTKYTKVQEFMKRVYPWLAEPVFSGKNVFDAFGGIPLPTYFAKADLNAAVTAKKAVRLCDTAAFYSGGEFISTMLGWAFSATTGEAANITVKGDGANGMKATHLMKLKVKDLQLVKETDPDTATRTVVQGSGSLVSVRKGNIYNPGRPPQYNPCQLSGVPQFHVYEPVLGRMMTYDMRYGRNGTAKDKCDAPIFCSYIKDDLHILNYFMLADVPKIDVDTSDREPCQVTGTWTETKSTGRYKAGHFYNSTMDFRREVETGASKSVIKEWPAYDYTMHSQADFFSVLCYSERHYFNHHSFQSESHGGTGWSANVGTCSTDRSIYFVGTLYTKTNGQKLYGEGVTFAGKGPQIRWSAMYHFITHWAGPTSPAPSLGCTEPLDDFVETVESCFDGDTESLVGKVKNYSLTSEGKETCSYFANMPTGGYFTGHGVFGNWMSLGGYANDNRAAQKGPEPGVTINQLTGGHEAVHQVYIFGAPLMNGRMIREYKATASANDEPFGLEFAPNWFKFSLDICPVSAMPVCRNFYGKDFMSTYDDRSLSQIISLGSIAGLGPTAIPVGGFI